MFSNTLQQNPALGRDVRHLYDGPFDPKAPAVMNPALPHMPGLESYVTGHQVDRAEYFSVNKFITMAATTGANLRVLDLQEKMRIRNPLELSKFGDALMYFQRLEVMSIGDYTPTSHLLAFQDVEFMRNDVCLPHLQSLVAFIAMPVFIAILGKIRWAVLYSVRNERVLTVLHFHLCASVCRP